MENLLVSSHHADASRKTSPNGLNSTPSQRDAAGSGARSRFTPQPRGGLVLGERDEELIADLYLHRAMTRGQLASLYFGSVPRCNFRLRQLYDWNYVRRYYLPAAPYGAQAVYLPGPAAVPLIAARLEMDAAEVRRQCHRQRTPLFLEHTLKIVDMRLAFQAATLQSDVEIERWLPECLCRHEYEIRRTTPIYGASDSKRTSSGTVSWMMEVFKPDAFVRLAQTGSPSYSNYFFEVDLGHTSARQFRSKLRIHERYLQSGLFASIYDCDHFTTLVVTTSVTRLRHLLALVEASSSTLFWFTTFEAVNQEGVLEAIWHAPGCGGLRKLCE